MTTPIPRLFSAKSPSERRSYGFDFSAASEFQYAAGQTPQSIASYVVDCPNNDGTLNVETPILSGSSSNPLIVSVYLNGGSVGMTYHVRYTVTTNLGNVIQRTVLLPVRGL